MATRTLTTGQVISLGDGRLACHFDEVHKVLDDLLDDHLMVHQIPRASRFAEPFIRDACPWVADLPALDLSHVDDKQSAVLAWVDQISATHGERHTVPDLAGQWVHFDAIDEAVAMFGPDRVLVVEQDPFQRLRQAADRAREAFETFGDQVDTKPEEAP